MKESDKHFLGAIITLIICLGCFFATISGIYHSDDDVWISIDNHLDEFTYDNTYQSIIDEHTFYLFDTDSTKICMVTLDGKSRSATAFANYNYHVKVIGSSLNPRSRAVYKKLIKRVPEKHKVDSEELWKKELLNKINNSDKH